MKYVIHKAQDCLTEDQIWHVEQYLGMSKEIKTAYELKEVLHEWFLNED